MVVGQPFRMWRMYVVLPDSRQITVMWNRRDSTEYVYAYLEAKVGVPIGRKFCNGVDHQVRSHRSGLCMTTTFATRQLSR